MVERDFLYCTPFQTDAGGSPSLLYNFYRVSFPGLKRPGRDVDHPPPYITEVKEEYSYTSTTHCALMKGYGETFTFTNPIKKNGNNMYHSIYILSAINNVFSKGFTL